MLKRFFLLKVLILISMSVSASHFNKLMMLGYGVTDTRHNQNIALMTTPAPGLTNRYVNDPSAIGAVLLGLGAESEVKNFANDIHVYLGGSASFMKNEATNGVVNPLINVGSDFDTLGFTYDVESYLLMANLRLTKENVISNLTGYLVGGLGIAMNRLSNYQEYTPVGSTAAPTLFPFAPKNQTGLAYAIGFGVTHKIGDNSEVGLGYYYLDAGAGGFNTVAIQQTSQQLKNINLRTHFLNLIWII